MIGKEDSTLCGGREKSTRILGYAFLVQLIRIANNTIFPWKNILSSCYDYHCIACIFISLSAFFLVKPSVFFPQHTVFFAFPKSSSRLVLQTAGSYATRKPGNRRSTSKRFTIMNHGCSCSKLNLTNSFYALI